MENKIFIISFMKSGITSATEFLKELKLTQAWPINFTARELIKYGEFDIHLFNFFYKNNNFASDGPIFLLWKYLEESYPNSKFICTERSVDSWYKSFNNWHKVRNLSSHTVDNIWNYWLKRPDLSRLKKTKLIIRKAESDGMEEHIKDSYLKHHDEIKSYFKNKNNLFYSKIEDVDSNKLKSFLNIKNNNVYWGHHNKTIEWI